MRTAIFVALIFSIHAVSFDTPLCRPNNFTAILREEGVAMLTRPQTTNVSCGEEWATHGTCCEFNSLKKVILKDLSKIHQQAHSFKKFVKKIGGLLKSIHDAANVSGPTLFFKKIDKTVKNQLLKLWINNGTALTVQENDVESCWTVMASMRSSSVCFSCSGRSSDFFKNGKAVIQPSMCNTAFSECHRFFEMVAEISRLASHMLDLLHNTPVKAITNHPKSPKYDDPLHRLALIFCENPRDSSTCKSLSNQTDKKKYLLWLCSKFVRPREKTLLEEIDPLVEYLDYALIQIQKAQVNVHKKTVQPPIMGRGRPIIEPVDHDLLKLEPYEPSSNSLIDSEIVFLIPSLMSRDVQARITRQKPMNFSLQFP